MIKIFNPEFTINIASKPKREPKPRNNSISRRCLAVVAKIDGEYKAIVNYDKKNIDVDDKFTLKNEQLVLPFTKKSLDLKGKIYVWHKEKDEYGHNVCVIRTSSFANRSPGVPSQYDAVKENILISGYIVRIDDKMYFEYEDLVKYHYLAESNITEINIDESKPLFNK